MNTINVDGLPEPVVRSLENLVNELKEQFAHGANLARGEGLLRAAGSWADADEEEFSAWLDETYRARKLARPELLP